MPRFLSVSTVPGMDREKLSKAAHAVRDWRPDPRTTILKVYCSPGQGKVFTECDAAKQEDFEAWLKAKGWNWEAIYPIGLVAQTGNIWQL